MAIDQSTFLDLRELQSRLASHQHNNSLFTFEQGQIVKRSYADVHNDVAAACAKLTAWGLRPGMRVGIRASNCYEWVVYDLALLELRAVSVAFTDDFRSAKTADLFEKYSLSLLLVSKAEGNSDREGDVPIAYLDDENSNIRVLQRGAADADPEYNEIGSIFSSGSSGGLKGLILNRRGVEATVNAFTQAISPRHDDCLLLFLPISNFQQRMTYYSAFWWGFDLIVTDPNHLFRALKELRPTLLIAPPALYEAFESRFDNLPPSKRWMAQMVADIALAIPIRSVRERIARFLFRSIHNALGGRMRFMVTGMAPIKRSTLNLCRRMQLPLFETYGLVEFGSVSLNLPGANRIGSVGRLLPGVRLEFASDGEIIVHRKDTQARSYFECAPGELERTFIGDSSVETGDIGRMDQDGYLYLVGRKKEIIITGGGEKVHPEAIEAELDACVEVARSVVFSSQESPTLIAVVLPKNPQGGAAVQERIQRFVNDINQRHRSMNVGQIIFTDQAFTCENGFLRPNLKLDRKRIAQHFQPTIVSNTAASKAHKWSA